VDPSRINEILSDPALDSRQTEVEAGTVFYEPDAPATSLYFIRSGQVRVFQPGRQTGSRLLEILGPGDWFGMPALSASSPTYGTRATAVSRVGVCQVPAERLLAHLANVPAVAAELIGQLATKLRAAYDNATNLVFDDTNQRLIKTLLQFSRTAAAAPQENGEGVVLRITHQQLAQAVGAARETVSLALTQLRQQNLLQTGRNRLRFSPTALEEFARRRTPAGKAAEAGNPA
jgi:CRP-like cAMP-binding protein